MREEEGAVAAEIHVPELGESVADATVGRWLKQEGEAVKSGDPLVELETDKINFEVEAEQDGVPPEPQAEEEQEEQPQAEEEREERPQAEQPEAEETGGEEQDGHREVEDGAGRASPSVRKLAQEYEVDLAEVTGSGSGGRITRDDVERLIRAQSSTVAPEKTEAPDRDGKGEAPQPAVSQDGRANLEERVRVSRRRQTIAQRLVESQQATAMLTTFNEADMSAVMELRKRRKESFQ